MLNIIRSRSRRKSKIETFDDSPDSGLESGGSTNKYELEMHDYNFLWSWNFPHGPIFYFWIQNPFSLVGKIQKFYFSSRAPVSLTSAWPQKGDTDGVKNPNSNTATSQMDSILRFFTDTEVGFSKINGTASHPVVKNAVSWGIFGIWAISIWTYDERMKLLMYDDQ